ncbi:MAG: hypothetical protein C4311_15645 [Chloroflexota bacterium]
MVLAYERGEVVLEVVKGRLDIDRPARSQRPGRSWHCRLSQADLVNLLLGSYASPDWLDGLGLPDKARPLLETLFPPAGGIFWLTDNF